MLRERAKPPPLCIGLPRNYAGQVSRHSKVPRLAQIGGFLSAGPYCGGWRQISREETTLAGGHRNQDLICLIIILVIYMFSGI